MVWFIDFIAHVVRRAEPFFRNLPGINLTTLASDKSTCFVPQMRYNKRKRGPYKEAIKQATTEAKRGDLDIPPGLFSSPTQVDVMS